MAFAPELDTLEGLPEPVKGTYTKREDGKFVFNPEAALNNLVALRTNRDELLGEKRKLKSVADLLGEHQLDADGLKSLLEQQKTAKEEEARKAGNFEQLKASLEDAHNKKVTALTAREQQLLGVIYDLMVVADASSVLQEAKGSPELLMPHIRERTKTVEENGRFRTQVIDPATKTERYVAGNSMTLKDLVTEMKADAKFARAFDGTGASGSGAPAGGGRAGGAPVNGVRQVASRAEFKSDAEKAAYIGAYGLEAFKGLPVK